MKFKLPKKFQNKNINIITFDFDDSVYGSEIKPEWGYSMIDAMCYCKNREIGLTSEEAHQVILDYQINVMEELMNM